MLRAIILLILTGSSILLHAQNTVSGKVSTASGEAIPGANVHLLNTHRGTASDGEGNYRLGNIPQGTYHIHVSAIGFAAVDQLLTIDQPTQTLDVTLAATQTQLETIVVTAQKTEEDAQKVPFSMTALPAQQILEYRIWNSKDITAIAPNVYSTNPGDGRNVTSIRGITSTSYDPSVATYIDGVNQFGLDTYIAQLSDIERIEVLRGPQGTLYGRNAMGGVINIITKQPTNNTTGFGELNLGGYGQQRFSAGVRTPLVKDKLFLGVSGMFDRTDGFYTNAFDGSHFDKKHSVLGNYYLKYYASAAWAFTLNVKHNENRNNGTFPLASSVEAAFAEPFTVNQNAVGTMIDNTFNTSFAASYVGRGFNFTSQTSYQSNYRHYDKPLDGDFSPIDGVTIINDYGKNWNNVKVVTEELKFSSPTTSTSPLHWTVGSYLFYQDNPVRQSTHFGEDAKYVGAEGQENSSVLTTTTGTGSGVAFFGQATYAFTPRLNAIAGLRYDYEHKQQTVPDPIAVTRPDTSATVNFHAVSPKLGLTYAVNVNSNVYATYARGFRAGGLTAISPDPSQPPLFAYKPEYSNNVEVGTKNMLFNNRLKVNVSAFFINATDVQVPTLILPQAFTVTQNAGTLRSAGVEAEISTTLLKNLQFDYNIGYTDAKFTTLNIPDGQGTENLKGNHQLFTPNVTSMLAAQYSINLSSSGEYKFIIRGEWQYLGEQFFDLQNMISQSPYHLFNTRVGVAGKGFEVMAWGRNLSDARYISYAFNFGAARLGDPRNWGITFRKNF